MSESEFISAVIVLSGISSFMAFIWLLVETFEYDYAQTKKTRVWFFLSLVVFLLMIWNRPASV